MTIVGKSPSIDSLLPGLAESAVIDVAVSFLRTLIVHSINRVLDGYFSVTTIGYLYIDRPYCLVFEKYRNSVTRDITSRHICIEKR